jgi:hypothetical protein
VLQVPVSLFCRHSSLSCWGCPQLFEQRGLQHDQSGGQKDWKWCKKYQVLSFTDVAIGSCLGGGVHDVSQSANYGLLGSGAWVQGQAGWKWCNKCQGLAYTGKARPGKCQVGGGHDHTGSGDYTISLNGNPAGRPVAMVFQVPAASIRWLFGLRCWWCPHKCWERQLHSDSGRS